MKSLKLSAVLLLIAGAVHAADAVKSVEATGEAAIVDNDEVKAREEAKKAALRNAVEQVAGTMVSATTLTRNSQLVSDRIFSNSAGYVKSYSTPTYTRDGGVIVCKLTAQVSTASLDKDLQAVQALVKNLEGKRLIVLLQEQVIDPKGVVTQTGVMSDILTKQLRADGWTLIDPAFANGKLKLGAGVALGQAEAKEIGNLTKADYVLYGTAAFRQQDLESVPRPMVKGLPVFMVTGEYSITVFATDTGTQLGTVAGKITYDGKDREKASQVHALISYERTTYDLVRVEEPNILGKIRKLIYDSLSNSAQNGTRVVVDVKGLPDYGAAEDFKKVLEQRRGVQAVDVNYADGTANYDVVFVGSSGDLASQFRSAGGKHVTFQGKKVMVTAKSANRVELSLK